MLSLVIFMRRCPVICTSAVYVSCYRAVFKDAKIFRVDKTDNTKYQVNPNDPGTTISWIYTNTDTNQEIASDWTKLPIGHYKLECSIKGNSKFQYTGSIFLFYFLRQNRVMQTIISKS